MPESLSNLDPLVRPSPPDFLADIKAFHEKFGLAYDGKPRVLPPDLAEFRLKFMGEELREWAFEQEKYEQLASDPQVCLEQQLDALVDLMYVQLGTVYLQGLGPKFEEAWRRVQAANMAKVRVERAEDSKRGSTFDVIKPAGWTPPDHSDLVADHAHK